MGRRTSGRKGGGGGRGRSGGAEELDEDMYDEVDQFHRNKEKNEDYINLNGSNDDDDESEDGEGGVFDLDVGSDDEESSDEEEEEEDDDDEDDVKQNGGFSRGMERAGLLSDEEDEDDDDEEDGKRAVRQWGTSKQQYYNADATDLEIGQDFADAEEEEEAAREVEQARYDEMDEDDYGLDDEGEEEDDDAEAGTMGTLLKGKTGKQKAKGGAAAADNGVEETRISRNLSKLSWTGKLQVLMTDSPELLNLLEEFKEKLGELKDRVEPLLPLAHQGGARITEEGVAYLEVKQQLLLSYCINLTYYMLLKAEGKSVKDHPVINQLLELRAALEKMRPLDAKLKYHIDRLLKVAEDEGAAIDAKDPLSFRPNPDALIGKGRGGGDKEGEEEEEEEAGGKKGGVYKPPRLAAVPYDLDVDKKGKEEAKARRNLEKLRRSEIVQTLTEQFSDKPELVAERGMTERQRKQTDDEDERKRFEEERFIRLVTTKKDKKARRAAEQQATRLETIADIGDFHDLEQSLSALGSNANVAAGLEGLSAGGKKKDKAETTGALQRAVNSLAQKEKTKKRRREAEMGDADVPYRNSDEIRVRRPVPDEPMDGGEDEEGQRVKKKKGRRAADDDANDDDYGMVMHADVEEDPLYEAIASTKKQAKAAKEAMYAVEPTYGAMEEELMDGEEKRGINYNIMKNRGLAPYKNKLNRNPRVKKREAYRKAVIRRKGQVRDVRANEGANYGGETTGINAKVVRKRGKSA